MEWMMWLLVILAALVAYIVGRNSAPTPEPEPEPKRFGLNEAEAALKYVKAGGTVVAQAILATVVEVLKYENAVADDVEEEVGNLEAATERRSAKAGANEEEIEALQAEIERLLAANGHADERIEQLRKIVEIFRG